MSKATDFLAQIESSPALQPFYTDTSVGKINIKPLSFKQQKALIASSADGVRGIMQFAKIVNEVLIENTQRSDIRSYDKLALIIALRINALGAMVDKIDLQAVLDTVASTQQEFDKSLTINVAGIELQLSYPTLQKELNTINACSAALSLSQQGTASSQIELLYAYELVKYIDWITIEGVVVDFLDISIQDQVLIIDKLPAELVASITRFLNGYQKYEDDCLSKSKLNINAALFTQ